MRLENASFVGLLALINLRSTERELLVWLSGRATPVNTVGHYQMWGLPP